MKRVLKRQDLLRELSDRTGFFVKGIESILNALEDVIIENMNEATLDERSEVQIVKGVVIGAYRKPEGEARNPRNGEIITTPEKIIPYSKFPLSFKRKINN